MKRILIVSALLLSTLAVNAQYITLKGDNGLVAGLDTVTNAATEYLTVPAALNTVGTTGDYTLQVTATQITGTTAGNFVLESSLDGVTYENHFGLGVPGIDGNNCDTFTVAGTKTHLYKIRPGALKYYGGSAAPYAPGGATFQTAAGRVLYIRARYVQTGTSTTQIKGRLITGTR